MAKVQNNSIKKIVILLPTLNIGGAERLVLEEMSFLKDDPRFSFEVHVVFEAGALYDKFISLKIPVHVWNAPHKKFQTFLVYLKIIGYLRRNRFNILHAHLLNYFGPWVGRLAGLKVFHTLHIDTRINLLQRFCLRRSDVLFGCGAHVLKNLKVFIPDKAAKLLSNAVTPVTFQNGRRDEIFKKLNLRRDNKVVLSLGRLKKQKGYDLLIDAFRSVVEKQHQAILLIGGDGPERENLTQQIIAMGMKNHIRLLGLVNNVDELLEVCDVYVNSSRYEGLPITLLEAMAHKKPIVATDVGGNAEVVKHNKTGFLVPYGQLSSIADAIVKILEDKVLKEKLGEGAFAFFQDHHTIERHCETLVREYLN